MEESHVTDCAKANQLLSFLTSEEFYFYGNLLDYNYVLFYCQYIITW